MNLSYRWLQRHIDCSDKSPETIADDLTIHVAEVEGVIPFADVLADVIVGRVLSANQHPNADKLRVCSVDVGAEAALTIVCGAPNVAAGQNVAVARVGTTLPGNFKIKRAKIRGQESEGMICSEQELGLGDEHDGIWVLPASGEAGQTVQSLFGGPDWTLEIDNKSITHRPDLWGHRGIAAELSALWSRPLLPIDLSMPTTGDGAPFPVEIKSERCSRYVALPIEGVRAERSPDWLRLLLLAVDQRPIDCLVDVSNFVMLDLGQPNHLFDRHEVAAGIRVRDARAGETMVTLDGMERKLGAEDLLICAGDEPVALAGIMGGEASKVEGATDSLLLEVATFDAPSIHRTSARLGLRTDASARFEKALDPNLALQATGHLVRVLSQIQPDLELPSPLSDVGDWTHPECSIRLRSQRVRRLLGVDLSADEIRTILESLRFLVEPVQEHPDDFDVQVPSNRATRDIGIEEDLIEEIGRIYGYGRIPETAIRADLEPRSMEARRHLTRQIEDFLSGSPCFHEAYRYSFVSESLVETLGEDGLPHVEVINAIASGLDRIRRSVAPSLLASVEENLRRTPDLRLFEIGKGAIPEHPDKDGKADEIHQLGMVWAIANEAQASQPAAGTNSHNAQSANQAGETGPGSGQGGSSDSQGDLFLRMKSVVEALLQKVGHVAWEWTEPQNDDIPAWSHPQRAAAIYSEKAGQLASGQEAWGPLAMIAELDPIVRDRLKIEGRVLSATISIDHLLAAAGNGQDFKPLPRFPGIKIDVALACDLELRAAALESAIRKAGKANVADIQLFDVYTGAGLAEGKKSLAYHVLLQAGDRTLTDKEGQKFLDRLERQVQTIGAELRRS